MGYRRVGKIWTTDDMYKCLRRRYKEIGSMKEFANILKTIHEVIYEDLKEGKTIKMPTHFGSIRLYEYQYKRKISPIKMLAKRLCNVKLQWFGYNFKNYNSYCLVLVSEIARDLFFLKENNELRNIYKK